MAPIILTLLPIISISAVVEDILFHQLMLWLVLPTSVIALLIGCRKHRQGLIFATGILGMGILIFVAFWGHALFGPTNEKIVTSLGGIVLAISHILNYRACQSITCGSKDCTSQHHH